MILHDIDTQFINIALTPAECDLLAHALAATEQAAAHEELTNILRGAAYIARLKETNDDHQAN